jgi:hypothetical protein
MHVCAWAGPGRAEGLCSTFRTLIVKAAEVRDGERHLSIRGSFACVWEALGGAPPSVASNLPLARIHSSESRAQCPQ